MDMGRDLTEGPMRDPPSSFPTSPMSWWCATGADLLEKNLIEIQNLRQRLEESVFINDRLRERLEYVLSDAGQGKGRKDTNLPALPTSGGLTGRVGSQL